MVAVDSYEWFLERSKEHPDAFVESLNSPWMSERPYALINAIEAARCNLPESKLVPALKRLLSQPSTPVRFCVLNALGTYYDAAGVEIEYLSQYDPDPSCRTLARKIIYHRQIARLVSSYVFISLFIGGWAISSAFDIGYSYLFSAACIFVLNFALTLLEVKRKNGEDS